MKGARSTLITDEDNGIITHSFMSTEERLCAFLVENGRMEQLGRAQFRMLPNAKAQPVDA